MISKRRIKFVSLFSTIMPILSDFCISAPQSTVESTDVGRFNFFRFRYLLRTLFFLCLPWICHFWTILTTARSAIFFRKISFQALLADYFVAPVRYGWKNILSCRLFAWNSFVSNDGWNSSSSKWNSMRNLPQFWFCYVSLCCDEVVCAEVNGSFPRSVDSLAVFQQILGKNAEMISLMRQQSWEFMHRQTAAPIFFVNRMLMIAVDGKKCKQ